jgi:malonate transporter
MLNTILSALLPMVATFLFGFVAAWRHDFGPNNASTLNRLVLTYAVPLAIFAGTVTATRGELIQDFALVVVFCVGIIGLYSVVFLFARIAFQLRTGISALAALTASAPSLPFVGPAVLGDLLGRTSAIPIAIGSLVINLTVVPVTILFLTMDTKEVGSQGNSVAVRGEMGSAANSSSGLSILMNRLGETVKEPLVWAPVLAFVIVLSGLRIPELIVSPVFMLGNASGGVALFASGIVLASSKVIVNGPILFFVILKNIVQATLVLVGLRWLGYHNPIVREAVLATAIPAMPVAIMLALKYRVAEAATASTVFLSVMGSVITMGIFIALTS